MTVVIDAHAHVFARADMSARGVDELAPAEREAPVERFGQHLKAVGASSAVLVPLDANDAYVARCVADDPARFRGVAVASPVELGRAGGDPLESLLRRKEVFPFSAVRTMWLGEPGKPLVDSPAMPLLRYMEESGLILWSYLPPDQAVFLDEVGSLFPDLRVVLNHFGFTPFDMQVDRFGRPRFGTGLPSSTVENVAALSRFENFFLMFSGHYALSAEAYPYPDLHEPGARLVGHFGPERTLWGSDSPWIDNEPGYEATADLVDIALTSFSAVERDRIRGATAASLFGFSQI